MNNLKKAFSNRLTDLVELFQRGQYELAIKKGEKMEKIYPKSDVLLNILGASYAQIGNTNAALKKLKKSKKINPKNLDTLLNIANCLKILKRFNDAIVLYRMVLSKNPNNHLAWSNIGTCYNSTEEIDRAIDAYRKSVLLQSDFAPAWNNLGNALEKQGNLTEAIAAYQRASVIKPDSAETHFRVGNALDVQGKLTEAIAAYQRALAIKPDSAETHFNVGNAFNKQGKLDEAIAAYQRALAIEPDYPDAHTNMGEVFYKQGKSDEAIAAFQRALAIKPSCAVSQNNLGNLLGQQGKLDEAIAAYQRALAVKPELSNALGMMLGKMGQICDWGANDQMGDQYSTVGIETDAIEPFSALAWEDHPERQLLRSQKFVEQEFNLSNAPIPARPKTRPERLRIGYFSSDLHENHPVFNLFSGLPREHDRSAFEVYGYDYSGTGQSARKDALKKNFTQFFDVHGMSDETLVRLSNSHKLDFAIDLNGYTSNTRVRLFQHRIAPIQVHFLGYPGSLGANFIDYIIADPTIIPREQRSFYSENVIYLPHSFQPNDDRREIASTTTTRANFGLPENGFVFCSFNSSYKISPREYDIWMRIIARVEDSVLWLRKSNRWSEGNLRKEADCRGINPERIIFADHTQTNAEHLARHKHADLFIDTFNYNAHTTASDALWTGLPLVTKQGEQFAARVAASLLKAVGLPELITSTEEEYEALVLELATNRDKLQQVKEKLAANRLSKPLFDTKSYTRNLENGLLQAYERFLDGYAPTDIWSNSSDQPHLNGPV